MKMNKFFMLGLAGLAFAACSNDDEPGQAPVYVENGAVSVKIVKPAITKVLSDGETVNIQGKLTVTLVGKTAKEKEENDYRETIVIDVDKLASVQNLTFWNIAVPDSLIASINGGALSYEKEVADKDEKLQLESLWGVDPKNAPAYGVTTKFVLNGGTGSPDLSNDNNPTNNKPEAGANEGDQNKVYDKYTATVTMAIPMARLEVGAITYKAPDAPAKPIYATLTYTGSYLDKYVTYGTKYNEEEGVFPVSGETVGNYWFEENAGATGQAESLMKFPASGTPDFLTTPIVEGGCFNFFAAGENPQFKLYFKEGTINPDSETEVGFPRYAMITKYLDSEGNPVTMENGHIYKITAMELDEPHFIPNEDGGTTYGVVVTVKEAQWQVESVSGVWGE